MTRPTEPEGTTIDTVIFDGEGVVIDTESLWDRAQSELLGRRGIVYDRARLKPLLTGRSSLEGAATLVRELRLPDRPVDLARERLEIVRAVVAEEVDFIPGFEAFFARASRSFKTAMATAMDEELLAVAEEKLALSRLFGGRIVTLSDVGHRSKPDPDLFLEAARRAASEPGNCAVIEDAPHGIVAAHRAGMVAIGLATTYEPDLLASAGADLVISGFEELPLERLRGLRAVRPAPSAAAALRQPG